MDKSKSQQAKKNNRFVIGLSLLSLISICAIFSFPQIPATSHSSSDNEQASDHSKNFNPTEPPVDANWINSTDFFVSESGSDKNPGTETRPWKTIEKCAKSLASGQTCHVLEGMYPEHVTVRHSGSDGSPITFKAVGKVTMNGFTIYADFVTIDGFEITDTEDYWDSGWGIFYQGTHGIIENNYIYFATRGGILIFTSPGNEILTNNVLVKNNRLYKNALVGIEIHGRDNVVEGNEIWGTIQHHPKWADSPSWVDADGITFFGQGHVIRNNNIHDIQYGIPENINPHIDCFQTWGDSNKEAASNIIIEQNHCINLQAQSGNEVGQGFMMGDASNIIIRNNFIEAFRGVNIIKQSQNIVIVNNTFIGNPDPSLIHFYPNAVGFAQSSGGIIVNNIFYNYINTIIKADSQSAKQLIIKNNNAFRADGVVLTELENYPDNFWNQDPMFVDPINRDYHLLPNSPLIGQGMDYSSLLIGFPNQQLPRETGFDIGAFEFLN